MAKKSMHIAAYLLAAIMLGTGALYLGVASDEYRSHQQEAQANTETDQAEAAEQSAENPESDESGFGDMGEIVFFSIVGVSYIPVGLWMLRKKEISKKPYVIALIGSAALILFYVATRTVNIPMIGLQDDVGLEDMTAKILQGAIVAISGVMLFAISKHRKAEQLA